MLLKRSILVVFTGYILFLLFSYVAEYESLILPLFPDKRAASPTVSGERAAIEKVLDTYSKGLTIAYAAKSPNKLDDLPMADAYKQEIITDILFQVMKKRALQIALRKIEIKRLDFMATTVASVEVHEVWDYSYKYDKGVTGPEKGVSSIDGVYTMQKTVKGWQVVSFTINEGRRRNVAG